MALSTTALLLPLRMSLLKCEYGAQEQRRFKLHLIIKEKNSDILRDPYALNYFSVLK